MMDYPEPFGIKYDRSVKEGTAELYTWEYENKPFLVLYFHDHDDHLRWQRGESFRLVNHWTREAPKPQYDKAERMNQKR